MKTNKFKAKFYYYCNEGLLTYILYVPLMVVLLVGMPFNKLIYGNWKYQSDKHSFVKRITRGL